MKAHDELVPYLYEALSSPHGIVVAVSDYETAKRRLYAARADLRQGGDFSFDILQFHPAPVGTSPPPDCPPGWVLLYIVKGGPPAPKEKPKAPEPMFPFDPSLTLDDLEVIIEDGN